MQRLVCGLRSMAGFFSWNVGRRRWGWLALALLAALSVAGATVATTTRASADTRPPGGVLSDPVVRAVDIAGPAVVRVANLNQVQLTINLCGASGSTTGAVYSLGSGAFVSANGDILTADHVVHVSQDELAAVVYQALIPLVAQNGACKGFSQDNPPTIEQVAALVSDGDITLSFSPSTYDIFRSSSYVGALSAPGDTESFLQTLLAAPHDTATVIASSPFEQDDVALLHVPETDTPSIQLDDSATVAVQDQLTIIGFPGNGDLPLAEVPGEPDLGGSDPTNAVTSSVNSIYVSAIKTNTNKSELIEVGGNVEHGDSGGPALDAAGHIVGIVSFGGTDDPDGTSFLRSSQSAQALMAQANINTQPGPFEVAWQQAFTDYAASNPGHWHRAAADLDALSAKYSDFHAVTPYRTYADTAAENETVSSASLTPSTPVLIVGAIGLGVLLLVVVGILLLAGRRRRTPPAPPPSQTGAQREFQPVAPGGGAPWTSRPNDGSGR